MPVTRLYLDVVHPAMVEIGTLWEQSEIGVAQEHLATQITQLALVDLADRLDLPPGERPGSAIVTTSPGEHHGLGVRMVADFLEAHGWEALVLGTDVPAEEVAALAEGREVDVVAFSTVLPGNLLGFGQACGLLRRLPRPPLIVAGGRAWGGDRARALAAGADAFARDLEALLAVLAERRPPDA